MTKIIKFESEMYQTNCLSIEINKLIDFEFPSLKMVYILLEKCIF